MKLDTLYKISWESRPERLWINPEDGADIFAMPGPAGGCRSVGPQAASLPGN